MQILQGKARITGLEPAYDLRWPHHCRSVVHGYWLIFSCRLERPAPPHHVRIIYACFTNPSKHAPLLAFFFCNFCSVATEFLLSLLTLIFNLYSLLLFTHSQTALNWISLHYSPVSEVSASHNLRSVNQRLFGSAMPAQHTRSTGLLCGWPFALNTLPGSLRDLDLGRDSFRRLLKTHVVTQSWSI